MLFLSLVQSATFNPLICRRRQRQRSENYAKAFASKQGHYLIFTRKGKHQTRRQRRYLFKLFTMIMIFLPICPSSFVWLMLISIKSISMRATCQLLLSTLINSQSWSKFNLLSCRTYKHNLNHLKREENPLPMWWRAKLLYLLTDLHWKTMAPRISRERVAAPP